MKDLLKAIDIRVSRRVYNDKPLSSEHIDLINKEIEELNRVSGLSFSLHTNAFSMFDRFRKSYGLLKNVRNVVILAGDTADSNLYEKLGYYGEILVLKLTLMGLGTCWVSGSFDKNDEIFKTLDASLVVFGVITVGHIDKELSFREKAIHNLSHIKTKKERDLYTAENPSEKFLEGIKALAKSPTANNSLNFHVLEKDGKISMTVPKETSNNLCNLGIGKLHFEIGSDLGKFKFGSGGILDYK